VGLSPTKLNNRENILTKIVISNSLLAKIELHRTQKLIKACQDIGLKTYVLKYGTPSKLSIQYRPLGRRLPPAYDIRQSADEYIVSRCVGPVGVIGGPSPEFKKKLKTFPTLNEVKNYLLGVWTGDQLFYN
jgi:hypothetical protein